MNMNKLGRLSFSGTSIIVNWPHIETKNLRCNTKLGKNKNLMRVILLVSSLVSVSSLTVILLSAIILNIIEQTFIWTMVILPSAIILNIIKHSFILPIVILLCVVLLSAVDQLSSVQ